MFIKEWIELTLNELVDEIIQVQNIEEINKIIFKYAEEIYIACNKERITNAKI